MTKTHRAAINLFMLNVEGLTDKALETYANESSNCDPAIAGELARAANAEQARRWMVSQRIIAQ